MHLYPHIISSPHRLLRSSHLHLYLYNPIRMLYDAIGSLKCPRDRGLDHAVSRERHLKPSLNLKNFIISEPSKSIPLCFITQSKELLEIPFRPIEFIRKYPSFFLEFYPGSLNINPHVKLTPEVISVSTEERLLHESVDYKQDTAIRLLKLLMISKINKIPLFLLEKLKWELGLPLDYEKSLLPEFPDYFRVINSQCPDQNGKILELVCLNDEFCVSEIEKKMEKDGKIQFCLQYSKEFEMDKKYKKWVDEWQRLPYVSPYVNAMHLAAKTDESDKWVVAVLHEVLNLFVGKRANRESLLFLGDFWGLSSRFKRAFLQHPGIFYVSSKIGLHTVVLKDAYKRGMLIERHPLMGMRFKYVQLLNVVKDDDKSKGTPQQSDADVKKDNGYESKDDESGEEEDSEICDLSDDEAGEDDDSDEDEESQYAISRRFDKRAAVGMSNNKIGVERSSNGRSRNDGNHESLTRFSRTSNNPRRPMSKKEYGNGAERYRSHRTSIAENTKNSKRGDRSSIGRSINDEKHKTLTGSSWRNDKPQPPMSKKNERGNGDERYGSFRTSILDNKRNNKIGVDRSSNGQSRNDENHESLTRFSRRNYNPRQPMSNDNERGNGAKGYLSQKTSFTDNMNLEGHTLRNPYANSIVDNSNGSWKKRYSQKTKMDADYERSRGRNRSPRQRSVSSE